MKALALAVVAAAALAFSDSSLAAPRNVLVEVLINDQGLVLGLYQNTQVADISSLATIPLLRHGDDVHFVVINRGKKAHDFTIFGKATGTVKPGGNARFEKAGVKRGRYPYGSTTDKSKPFHGSLTVQ